MAGREGTVYGTDGSDVIYDRYVDLLGNSIWMLSDDDDTPGAVPDRITVEAGDGDDELNFNGTDGRVWRDQLILNGGGGNDDISVNSQFSWNPDARLIVDGGSGDDMITAWWPGTVSPIISGGAGADTFRVGAFEEFVTLTIADYVIGEDALFLIDNGESWEEITPELLLNGPDGMSGRYEAHDTDSGLRIDGYHGTSRWDGSTETWTYELIYSVTLTGVTLNDFMAGSGINIINGTDGRDIIRDGYVDADGDYITDGENLVLAGAGHDTVTLTMWNSTVRAGDGRDFVIIKGAGNTVYGEAGNDHLIARHGGSTLDGGSGDDRLVADIRQGGDHVLTGGEGADTFELVFGGASRNDGHVVITDFESDFDTLFLDGVQIYFSHLPDGVTASSSEDGWLVLNFGLNDSVELLGHPAFNPLLA